LRIAAGDAAAYGEPDDRSRGENNMSIHTTKYKSQRYSSSFLGLKLSHGVRELCV